MSVATTDETEGDLRLLPILFNIEEDLNGLTSGFASSNPEEQKTRTAKILTLVGLVHRSQEVVGPAAHKLWLLLKHIPLIFETSGDRDSKKIAQAIRFIARDLERRSGQ